MTGITNDSLMRGPDRLSAAERDGFSIAWLLAVLLRERRIVLICCGIGLLLGVAMSIPRKSSYTATFSFLPQTTQDPSRAGLASIAGQFGISLGAMGGAAQPPQLYADLMVTREVLTPIAQDSFAVGPNPQPKVSLRRLLGVPDAARPLMLDNTIRALRRDVISSNVAMRTTGMVNVSVRTRSPQVSLAIAQRLLDGLNHFNLATRQSQASAERRFTEGRLQAAKTSLRVPSSVASVSSSTSRWASR